MNQRSRPLVQGDIVVSHDTGDIFMRDGRGYFRELVYSERPGIARSELPPDSIRLSEDGDRVDSIPYPETDRTQ